MTSVLCHTLMRFAWLAALALLVTGSSAWAGGQLQYPGVQNPSEAVRVHFEDSQLPVGWLMSADGLPGSGIENAALAAEIEAAFEQWQAIAGARVAFEYDGEVGYRASGGAGSPGAGDTIPTSGFDGRHLVTFTDPDILFPSGVLAVALTSTFLEDIVITDENNDLDGDGTPDLANGSYPAGTILDADIVFNSNIAWSTDGAVASRDVRSVALHESGHFLGLSHSSVRDAVMFPFINQDVAEARSLEEDDIAHTAAIYPAEPAYSQSFGEITGRVANGSSGGPVVGAHVYAVDPSSGAMRVGAFSDLDGRYRIPGLVPSDYLVAIEALDGDPAGLDPARINGMIENTFDTSFPDEFYDAEESSVEPDPLASLPVTVALGQVTGEIDLVTNTGSVPGVELMLRQGYNLFAYPVDPPEGLRARELLEALGDSFAVNAIDRFFPGSSTFERAEYVAGDSSGADFEIVSGEGYVVHMDYDAWVGFVGKASCPLIDLVKGINLMGVPCPPPAYTAFDMLEDLGDPLEVESLQAYDSESGQYQTAGYDEGGTAVGDDFEVRHGEGYLVQMRLDKANVQLPGRQNPFAPLITGISPGRGVIGTQVLIIGQGFDAVADENIVTFDGVVAPVIFASSTSLTAVVPSGARSGAVRVNVAGRLSNTVEFLVEPARVDEGDAELLISGQTVAGSLDIDGEEDRYSFLALAGSRVILEARAATPGVPDLLLLLEDPHGVIVASDDDGSGGSDPVIRNHELDSSGSFTAVVTSVPFTGTGDYTLELSIQPPGGEARIEILGGNYQSGVAGSVLPLPLELMLVGAGGAPLSGVPVTFEVEDGDLGSAAAVSAATVDATNAAGTMVVNSNADGIIIVEATLGQGQGGYQICVDAPGLPLRCLETAITSAAVARVDVTPVHQEGAAGKPLPNPIRVRAFDVSGDPVQGALVAFKLLMGGGSIDQPEQVGLATDGNGLVETEWTLGTDVEQRQHLAVFVPGAEHATILEAKVTPDFETATVYNLRTGVVRMMLGTQYLNAFTVQVRDAHGNPIAGATVQYEPANPRAADLLLSPGLGPDGKLLQGYTTDAHGLHVLSIEAPLKFEYVNPLVGEYWSSKLVPSIDEFQTQDPAQGLAPTYEVRASVVGGGIQNPITALLRIDIDLGPHFILPPPPPEPFVIDFSKLPPSWEEPWWSEPIEWDERKRLELPPLVDLDDPRTTEGVIGSAKQGAVRFVPWNLLRHEGLGVEVDSYNCDIRNIDFAPAVGSSPVMLYEWRLANLTWDPEYYGQSFSISRDDGHSEAEYAQNGIEPAKITRRSVHDPLDEGSVNPYATRFTLGDVGGLHTLATRAQFIPVFLPLGEWEVNDEGEAGCNRNVGMTKEVYDANGNEFASGITLRTIPLVVRTEIKDGQSGVDLRSIVLQMNDHTYLDLSELPKVLPVFPERIDVIVDGMPLTAITEEMAKLLRPKTVVVEYYPHAKRIWPDNTVIAAPVGDLGGNYQSVETIREFSDEVLGE